MSLNLTYIAERKSDSPNAMINSCSIPSGARRAKGVNCIPVNSAATTTTIRLIIRDISELIIADNTIIYFGKLIFLNISPLPTIEFIPTLVASEKNPHREIPKSSTIGYCGVPSVNFKNLTKTVYITANNSSGFKTDHKIPKKEP